jgi:hypothetical protein
MPPRLGLLRALQQRQAQARLRATATPWSSKHKVSPLARPLGGNPALNALLTARLQQFHSGLQFKLQALNNARNFLQGLDTQLQNQVSSYVASSPYDAAAPDVATGQTSTQQPGAGTPTGSAPPSYRVLSSIFESLDRDDFTEDDYPKISVINEKLDDRGYPKSDKGTTDSAYDKFFHLEQLEKHEKHDKHGKEEHGGEEEHKRRQVTQKALFEVFADMEEDHELPSQGTPTVKAVGKRLNQRGFESATHDEVHSAFRRWKHVEEEEKEHEKRRRNTGGTRK